MPYGKRNSHEIPDRSAARKPWTLSSNTRGARAASRSAPRARRNRASTKAVFSPLPRPWLDITSGSASTQTVLSSPSSMISSPTNMPSTVPTTGRNAGERATWTTSGRAGTTPSSLSVQAAGRATRATSPSPVTWLRTRRAASKDSGRTSPTQPECRLSGTPRHLGSTSTRLGTSISRRGPSSSSRRHGSGSMTIRVPPPTMSKVWPRPRLTGKSRRRNISYTPAWPMADTE